MANVLIVHDDAGFQFGLGRVLERAGYTAILASGVEEAKGRLERLGTRIDLVIGDPTLRGFVGFIDSVRKAEPFLPVIGVTTPGETLRSVFRNVDELIPKPDNFDDANATYWLDTVRRVLTWSITCF